MVWRIVAVTQMHPQRRLGIQTEHKRARAKYRQHAKRQPAVTIDDMAWYDGPGCLCLVVETENTSI